MIAIILTPSVAMALVVVAVVLGGLLVAVGLSIVIRDKPKSAPRQREIPNNVTHLGPKVRSRIKERAR